MAFCASCNLVSVFNFIVAKKDGAKDGVAHCMAVKLTNILCDISHIEVRVKF